MGLFVALILAELHFGWQICSVNLDDTLSCRRIFISNVNLGWLVFAGFIAGHAIN
jgi:4-hydroxybenzoate polyprenyltransferase